MGSIRVNVSIVCMPLLSLAFIPINTLLLLKITYFLGIYRKLLLLPIFK